MIRKWASATILFVAIMIMAASTILSVVMPVLLWFYPLETLGEYAIKGYVVAWALLVIWLCACPRHKKMETTA